MTQKTKTLILIALILSITVGVGVYYFQKNKAVDPVSQIQENLQIEGQQQKKDEQKIGPTGESSSAIKTGQKVGTVSMVDPLYMIIEQVDGSSQYAIVKDAKFFKRESAGKAMIKFTDIKVGMNVLLRLNVETGEIIEAEVI